MMKAKEALKAIKTADKVLAWVPMFDGTGEYLPVKKGETLRILKGRKLMKNDEIDLEIREDSRGMVAVIEEWGSR